MAGGRAKRARKVPIRFTKQDVWYDRPLTFMTSSDDPPPLQPRPRFTLPSHLPTNDEDVLDRQHDQLKSQVKVKAPLYRLPRVHPFCLIHEVHCCKVYARRGSCYSSPHHRLRQLGRNVALRSAPLPPTVSRRRYEHSARTFAIRKARKPLEFRPQQESYSLVESVYEGAQAPRVPTPPRRVITTLRLPEPVDILDIASVVSIEPAEPTGKDIEVDGRHRHYAVRLRNGLMSVLSGARMTPGVTWRVQSANDVVVVDSSGRQFRNPSEGRCLTSVAVESNEGQFQRVPLATVNYQVKHGRSRLRSFDGGVVLFPNQQSFGKGATLHRVDMQTLKMHDSGMVVLRQDMTGPLRVVGVVQADDEEKEWVAEAVRILCGFADPGKNSASIRSMLTLLDIQHVWHLGAPNLPSVPIAISTATANAFRVAKPAASTTNDTQRDDLVIIPGGAPTAVEGGEKPRVTVAGGPRWSRADHLG